MSEKKILRNVGLNLTFTDSRKKSVIGKSLSSGEFPQGTVSTSRFFGMLTQGRMFATCPREYIVNPKEPCHETKEYLRALFCLDKLPSAKRICIERIMQKMIVPANEHIFLDVTSLPHLYLAELTSKTLQELNEELNNRRRLSDFKEQQGHTRNSRLLKDDTVSALVSFLKEKFFNENPCNETEKAEIEENFHDVVGGCISVISRYLESNPSNMRITDPVSLVSEALKNKAIEHKNEADFIVKTMNNDRNYANNISSLVYRAAKLDLLIRCADTVASEHVSATNRAIREFFC